MRVTNRDHNIDFVKQLQYDNYYFHCNIMFCKQKKQAFVKHRITPKKNTLRAPNERLRLA